MTATDQSIRPPVDVDTLPPTQYLILEVLAARHRTGEQLWTFPKVLRPQMRALAQAGLIGWKGGVAPGTVQAWLTDAGRAAALLDGYVTPYDEVADRLRIAQTANANQAHHIMAAHMELVRREQQHCGHGRDGHLNEDDLELIFDAVNR